MPLCRKTASGLAELKSRSLQLEPALRGLLMMIDGQKSEEMLLKYMVGATVEQFRALAGLGLVERVDADSPGPKPAPPPSVQSSVRPRAVDAAGLNHVISAFLGLAGLAMSDRARVARSAAELRAVAERVVELVRLRHGDAVAAEASRRIFGPT